MKLFIWQPRGHGQNTIYIMEENKEKALAAANTYVNEEINKGEDYCYEGWGTKYYVFKTANVGEVITQPND